MAQRISTSRKVQSDLFYRAQHSLYAKRKKNKNWWRLGWWSWIVKFVCDHARSFSCHRLPIDGETGVVVRYSIVFVVHSSNEFRMTVERDCLWCLLLNLEHSWSLHINAKFPKETSWIAANPIQHESGHFKNSLVIEIFYGHCGLFF